MAKDAPPGKPARFFGAPRSLSALLPPITRPAFKRRSPAAVQLLSDWPALVGPAYAAIAVPRRFAGGTLTLAVSGPAAMELQHQAPALIARINGALGQVLVERLRFSQEALPAASPDAPPLAPEPVPVALPDLPEGPLHDALARLGGRIAARRRF